MKNISKAILATTLIAAIAAGCTKILEETPRSIYEPSYFKTKKGVEGGLTAMYAFLRDIYGQAYYYNITLTGTDEVTYGASADANFKDADLTSGGQLTSSSSRADVIWNAGYTIINTASGLIENAVEVGIEPSLIAEAHFFRAFHYFSLVQTFGGVPLDLGSGELKFNSTPARTSVRNTVPEVYTKAIFPDLRTAVNDLPDDPRIIGAAAKTLARLYLAKAYLTYGWWLENPGNIPTYPECARTDPDGHPASWYFQQAYDVATEAIDNPGPFGLLDYYYDVHLASNDRNKEILLWADHTDQSEFYNGGSLTYGNGNAPDNFAVWMMTWQAENIRSATKPDPTSVDWVSSIVRKATQELGRPWSRMCPTIEVLKNTFADKANDSRYDGTFVTVYRGNWADKSKTYYNANFLPVNVGDPILTFLPEDVGGVNYNNTEYTNYRTASTGVLAGRADYVIEPSAINRQIYPGLWKLGVYRTDEGGVNQPNAASTRPFNIAKFSELYLVAAEAAVKGATAKPGKSARELVNVLRARAGKWRFSNAENSAKTDDNSAAMVAATPDPITIDYILEERSREFYGEGYRWFDLVRTQTWGTKAASYSICPADNADDAKGKDGTYLHTKQTFNRNIQAHHYLRPIPRGQLEAMDMTSAEKTAYQNPGYPEDFKD
ncbi:MAG: RagB/SusD family nutrient uptake outer membrane protein [Prevotellaceae bacterium]|jgi:hypothetical protein|nr:RagB/SusD family nutrient uptake outer membrane protein [Prevotellaceae bacterium]